MKSLILLPVFLFVVLLPLGLAAAFGGPSRPWHQELASGLGLLAYSIILAEFVLSGRFKSIANSIGLDVTMRFHQLIARTALLFALLHPLLYQGTPSGGPRPWDPTRALTVTNDFASLSTGIVAYLLLPALVVLALSHKQLGYKYETWRLMHGVGALLIAGLVLHHALSAGRYSANPALVWLWSGMTAVAVAAMVYIYLVVPLRNWMRKWRVESINEIAPKQWEVVIAPEGHAGLNYKAGQFAWLNIGHSPFSLQENPFSISSAPSGGKNLSFIIKEFGDFTSSLRYVQPGTRAYVDGPFGHLTTDKRTEPQVVLIAGGVGISPLLGILREMRLTKDQRKVHLLYGNRTEEQILYRDELDADDVTLVLSDPPEGWSGETGMIDARFLDSAISSEAYKSWLFVICGPPPMMDGVENHLLSRGVPSNRILSERFNFG